MTKRGDASTLQQGLAARVLALLSLALLPLGLIAIYQTSNVVNEASELARRDILARTAEAAHAEHGLIQKAFGAANALGAAAAGFGEDNAACSAAMARFVASSDDIIFAGYIARDGIMSCSNTNEPVDFSGFEAWQTFIVDPRPMVTMNRSGAVSQRSVMIASVPVRDPAGAFQGAVSVSIPHSLADTLLENRIENVDLALIDGTGTILSASTGIEDIDSFNRLELVPNRIDIPGGGVTFDATLDDGGSVTVALVELIENDLYALGKWKTVGAPLSVSFFGTATPLFPILMWLASLFVAFLAIDRLVLRHLSALRRRMTAFSTEMQPAPHVQVDQAPTEFVEIADSFNAMIDRIAADHAQLKENVREKEVLLKEVHHRVKNNLQLIASILNMQLRGLESPDAQRVLRRVQDRVMSLATIHKSLYSDTHVDAVRVDLLLRDIIASVQHIGTGTGHDLQVELDLDMVWLDPDQAVPLCLLATEAMTNAVKYAGTDGEARPRISVRLAERTGGDVHLRIENTCGPSRPETDTTLDGTKLGSRLIGAFVSQLDGTLETEATNAAYALDLAFTKFAVAQTSVVAAAE